MKLCITDQHGHPIAFYDDAIHKEIPSEAFEISDTHWQECIGNSGRRRFEDGRLVECVRPSLPAPSMSEQIKARAEGDPIFGALLDVLAGALGIEAGEFIESIAQRAEGE